MLVTVVVCIAYKRSKKKEEENMEVEENPVYQTYELVGENYERQYSTNEVLDHNPDYA